MEHEANARVDVLNQIIVLADSLDTCREYLDVINRSEEIAEGSISEYLIWITHQNIQMIIIALTTSLEDMPMIMNWDMCCQEAVKRRTIHQVRKV